MESAQMFLEHFNDIAHRGPMEMPPYKEDASRWISTIQVTSDIDM
jgi:hypothetical protein